MSFDEVLERFVATERNEVDALIERSKQESRRATSVGEKRPAVAISE
jgi:hypothetical protein